ncbi:prepilin peptidase [Marinicella sediminis]|uniref:Prepilin leader peptidase/N-methyltransferase n=1 Tax=Marinicella sediminis TaxID=1792834 RepID=A0ABV7JCL5_9GAMM|nr:A24 family peptidase [Marinicella sediminis]
MDLISLFQQSPLLLVVVLFVVGLIVGSFLNVVILRYPPVLEYDWKKDYAEFTETPFDQSKPPGLVFARSHCPKCKEQLSAWHNIPVISYLILRGRCHFCQNRISIRYPLIELFSGLLAALAAFYYGFSWQLLSVLMLIWFLLVITWIDIDTYLIPDQLSLSLLWLGLFCSLFDLTISPAQAITGALVGYLSLWLVFQLFKLLTGKEGMGYGDFKLLAAGGAWIGAEALIGVLMVASVTGLLLTLLLAAFGLGQKKIPFGPYLSVGILVAYFTDGSLLDLLLL